MPETAVASAVQFQVSLHATDLERSVHFYRKLLATEPALTDAHQVRFDLAEPPLMLTLVPAGQAAGSSINHVGLRMADSPALVEVQRRLEEAGIATQRQEGVECCYARQTKFWVTDPDRNLWELYVIEEDIDHSGFEDAPHAAAQPAAEPVVWEHRLTEPVPERIACGDASVDEVRLEGTFNARLADGGPAAFLAEVFRVLRPGGKLVAHALTGDKSIEAPALPGLAALVQRVPAATEALDALRAAGFSGLYFEKLSEVCCLQVQGVELREMRLLGWRPEAQESPRNRRVLYKGPLDRVLDDSGVCYPRGEAVVVSSATWQMLQQGPAAGQFLFFPVETAK